MFCPSCGKNIPDNSRFCESCGAGVAVDPQPKPAPAPDGFTYDPNSGLYYMAKPGINPGTGQPCRWITWFYPETGEYKQTFDATASVPAPQPTAFKATPAPQPVVKTPAAAKKPFPFLIVIPTAAVVVVAVIAFLWFGGFLGKSGDPADNAGGEPPVNGQSRSDGLSLSESTPEPNKGKVLLKLVAGVIATGNDHTVGLKPDGTVVATGYNTEGQCDVSSWRDIIAVAAGQYFTVGVKADGTVVTAGHVNGEDEISSWRDIIAAAAGYSFTVGLKSDGTVIAAGSNYSGQSNVGDWSDIVAIATGEDHAVGLKSDGTVVATGSNTMRQCEVGDWRDIVAIAAGDVNTFGVKSDGTVVAVGYNSGGQTDVSGWKDIVAISAGKNHTVGLKADGTAVAAGDNEDGRMEVDGWSGLVAVSAGLYHTIGVNSDGSVVAAGDNTYTQCDVNDWTLRTESGGGGGGSSQQGVSQPDGGGTDPKSDQQMENYGGQEQKIKIDAGSGEPLGLALANPGANPFKDFRYNIGPAPTIYLIIDIVQGKSYNKSVAKSWMTAQEYSEISQLREEMLSADVLSNELGLSGQAERKAASALISGMLNAIDNTKILEISSEKQTEARPTQVDVKVVSEAIDFMKLTESLMSKMYSLSDAEMEKLQGMSSEEEMMAFIFNMFADMFVNAPRTVTTTTVTMRYYEGDSMLESGWLPVDEEQFLGIFFAGFDSLNLF